MLDQKVLEIARSSIEVSFEERRSSFNEELSRKMRELQKSGNLPRESSRGAKIIQELCANELKSRAEIIWESLERAHESFGSQLNETLVRDLKEVVNHFIEEMAKKISTLMSKRSGLAKNEIKNWTLDSAKNLARKKANIEIDLYVNRLTQSSSGQKKAAETIFISHAAEDAVLAETIKTQIDNVFEKKINVFVSSIPGTISPGSDWLDKIIGNLTENNAFIVLVTPYSEKRPFVWFEIGFSWLRRLNRNCEIYAICAPPIDPGNLPEPLCRLQATSLASEKQARAFFDKLTKQFNMGNLGTIEFIKIHNSLPTYPSQITQMENIDEIILTGEAKTLLLEAVNDRNGRVLKSSTMRDTVIQTNGKNLIPDDNSRTIAKWEYALEELVNNDFVEERGHKGEVFAVTYKGYEYADKLKMEAG